MEKLPFGLWPVMLTPFNEDNEVDKDTLENLVEFYIQSGASGLFANCLSSEMFQLTEKERLFIIETTVKTCKSRIPVVATGTFYIDTKKNIDFIKKVYDLGVKAVVINTSLLVKYDDEESELKHVIDEILSKTGNIPLGAYECPRPYKRLLSPELLKWMASTNRFFYFKDTSCDTENIKKKLIVLKDSDFNLYNANIPTALESLQSGAAGLSPIGANFYPKIYTWFIKNFNDKKRADVVKKVNAILSTIDPLLHQFYPLSAKLFLQKLGIKINTNSRIPVQNMTNQDFIKINDLLILFNTLADEIGI